MSMQLLGVFTAIRITFFLPYIQSEEDGTLEGDSVNNVLFLMLAFCRLPLLGGLL